MTWSTPSFEEIQMDAEARGYAGWPEDPPASRSEEGASAAATDCTADRG
jgi:hypothetical protein